MGSPPLHVDGAVGSRLGGPLDALVGAPDPYRRLVGLVRPERRDLAVVAAYAVGSGLLGLAVPLTAQAVVNSIAFTAMIQPIAALSLVLLVALGFQGVLQAMQAFVVEVLQRRLFVRVAADLTLRLPRVARGAFDAAYGPELVNRFFGVFTIQKAVGVLLLDGAALVLQTGIGLVLMAFYHPVLLEFDLALIVALVLVLRVLGRGGTATSLVESKAKYAVAGWLEELALHPGAFRTADAALFAAGRTDALAHAWLDARRAHWRVLLRQLVGLLALQAVASATLLGVGGWLVVERELTLGQLVASEFVVASVVAGLVKLVKQLEAFYDLLAAVDKLGGLVDLPLERLGGEAPAATAEPAALALRGLRVALPDGPVVFDGLDWAVAAGARVGVAGATGAGLSTLADLLTGLRSPSAGVVEVDGQDVRTLDLRALRHQVVAARSEGVVLGTVLENMRLGHGGLSVPEARAALEAVGLWAEIEALPDQLETTLSTGGWPLSPGEADRLVIARAIAMRPRALVVDGLLDGLDPAARAVTMDAIFRRDARWTLVVLSRHPDVLARCDACWAIEGARLAPGLDRALERARAGKKRRRR